MLECFWETGTEGVVWSFVDKSKPGYYELNTIQGHHLIVLSDSDEVLWSGIVELEYERLRQTGFREQQAINGYWVHGFEKTLSPETWADYFFKRKRAILIKHPENQKYTPQEHIFSESADEIAKILSEMETNKLKALFKDVFYAWAYPKTYPIDPNKQVSFEKRNQDMLSIGNLIGLSYQDIMQCLSGDDKYSENPDIQTPENIIKIYFLYRIFSSVLFLTVENQKSWVNLPLSHLQNDNTQEMTFPNRTILQSIQDGNVTLKWISCQLEEQCHLKLKQILEPLNLF